MTRRDPANFRDGRGAPRGSDVPSGGWTGLWEEGQKERKKSLSKKRGAKVRGKGTGWAEEVGRGLAT